jgi:alpha-1,3-rhamnosyl/mannosyltransferase
MEEFCPDSSVFVNPRDTGALAEGLREILEDEGRFQQARESAGKVSGIYSWDSCARKTLEVYKRVLRK